MRMNTNIPMMGQQPDIVNALRMGTQAAGERNALMDQNAMRDLYRTQGAGILAGEQPALNALAGLSPQAALDVQSTQLSQQATRQAMQVQREQARRAAAEAARTASADEVAREIAEAQRIGRQLAVALDAGDEATISRIMEAEGWEYNGPDSAVAALAAIDGGLEGLMDGTQAIRSMRPAAPEETSEMRNLKWRAEQGGLVAGTPEYQAFITSGGRPAETMSLTTMPDGTFRMVQGVGAGGMRPLTEGQAKDNVYATRAAGALATLEPVADALTSRENRLREAVPFGLGRDGQTPDYQVAQQAGDEFLQAILRKDTGAAITADEQELYGKTFLPQPGDGPEVLEAKRQSRSRALEALRAGMSAEQIVQTEQAIIRAAGAAGAVERRRITIDGADYAVEPVE